MLGDVLDKESNIQRVEVAYATPDEQVIIPLDAEIEATIEQIIGSSGVLQKFPEIDLSKNKVGVFSVQKKLTDTLRDGDRVEIYRDLIIDPKQARKNRLAKQKEKKAAEKS